MRVKVNVMDDFRIKDTTDIRTNRTDKSSREHDIRVKNGNYINVWA